ncbi:MAG: hypothetical protein EHM83_12770 [Burkholderiales bacterium]|nr:MAG: hypothetical protein EHM83_12770 [Burkholderiales bacterium]
MQRRRRGDGAARPGKRARRDAARGHRRRLDHRCRLRWRGRRSGWGRDRRYRLGRSRRLLDLRRRRPMRDRRRMIAGATGQQRGRGGRKQNASTRDARRSVDEADACSYFQHDPTWCRCAMGRIVPHRGR